MTITDHLNFSVVSAPLESIDRRTLSQAWYSALFNAHLAGTESNVSAKRDAGTAASQSRLRQARTAQTRTALAGERATDARAASSFSLPVVERRRLNSPLGVKIQRALQARRTSARPTSFTIKDNSGRVQLLVHGNGARLTLVALCSAAAKADVSRALAHARYALSLRGFNVDAQTREYQC